MPQTGYGFENARRPAKSDPSTLDPWLDRNAESSADRIPPFVGLLIVCKFVVRDLVFPLFFTAALLGLAYLIGLAIYEAVQIADWVRAAL